MKKRNKSSNLTEERKAQKRANYHAKKDYYKSYRDGKKEEISKYHREFHAENREERNAKNRELYNKVKNNPEFKKVRRDYQIKYQQIANAKNRIASKKRPDKVAAKAAKRRSAKQKATPPWLTKEHFEEIQEFYTLAKELQWLFEGEKIHVDHITPLKGKSVCGLHVPWNLQLLPAKQNLKKSNKLI